MLHLSFKNETADKKWTEFFFNKIIDHSLGILGFSGRSMGVSVNLVGEARIKILNKKYRGKNKPTDVLSFSLNGSIAKISEIYDTIELGDIFICLPLAKKEAVGRGKSVKEYLAALTVHGFLHLLGYDHEKSEYKARKMFAIQSKIIKTLNLR